VAEQGGEMALKVDKAYDGLQTSFRVENLMRSILTYASLARRVKSAHEADVCFT